MPEKSDSQKKPKPTPTKPYPGKEGKFRESKRAPKTTRKESGGGKPREKK